MADLTITARVIGAEQIEATLKKVAAQGANIAKQMGLSVQQQQVFMKEFMSSAAQSVGQELGKMEEGPKKIGKAFSGVKGSIRDFIQTVSGVAALTSIFARNNEELQGRLSAVAVVLQAVAGGARVLFSSIKLLTAIFSGMALLIGGVIAAFVLLVMNWDKAASAAVAIWQAVSAFFVNLWEGLALMAEGIGEVIVGAFTIDFDKLTGAWDAAKNYFRNLWGNLATTAGGFGEIIAGAFTLKPARIKAGFEEFKKGMASIADDTVKVGSALGDAMDKMQINAGLAKIEAGAKKTAKVVVKAWGEAVAGVVKATDYMYLEFFGGNEKMRKDAEALADFQLRMEEITIDRRIELQEMMLNTAKLGTQELLQEQAKLADMGATRVAKQIEDIKREAQSTEELKAALEELAKTYQKTGIANLASLIEIQKALKNTRSEAEEFGRTLKRDMEFSGVDAAKGIYGAFEKSFTDIFTGAKTFKEGMKSLFVDMVKAILSEIAKVAAAKVFAAGAEGMGLGGWLGLTKSTASPALAAVRGRGAAPEAAAVPSIYDTAGGAGGSLIESVTASNETQAFASAMSDATDETLLATESIGELSVSTGSVVDAFGQGASTIIGVAQGLVQGVASWLNKLFSLLGGGEGGGGYSNFVSAFFGNLFKGLGGLFSTAGSGAAIGLEAGGTIGSVVAAEEAGLGAAVAVAMAQHGTNMIVSRPTRMLVGEVGPERITVQPLTAALPTDKSGAEYGQSMGGTRSVGSVSVQVAGPLILSDITMAQFTRQMQRSLQREGRRYG